jgi:uncharacterized protein (TIGR00269 family)
MRCDRCELDAVIDQPYQRAHVCELHFRESVVERARRELHRQSPHFRGGTIAVALSGGKDSAVALTLTQRYFGQRSNVEIVALSVDEGISGYRPATLERARELTDRLGVEHRIVRFSDAYATTTDQSLRTLPGTIPCAYCGVWRRQLLNRAARDLAADLLVLGFNLDDLAQTVLMNLARGDLDRLARMAPHRTRQPGLIPRIAPLAQIPEREVFLYAYLTGTPFDHGECPHALAAARNIYREVIWQLEEAIPGTRHALLRTQERLAPLLFGPEGPGEVKRCQKCGEPATGTLCRACEFLTTARNRLVMATASAPP